MYKGNGQLYRVCQQGWGQGQGQISCAVSQIESKPVARGHQQSGLSSEQGAMRSEHRQSTA
eukprot:531874-Lingulodinium_polyedra.AAC.1